MNEIFSLMILVKVGTVVVITVALSVLAEVTSPRVAGILTGFPLGAAVTLFFMGLEINTQFAAESALHTSAGVAAAIAFGYCYYKASLMAERLHRVLQILLACIGGTAGYLAAAAVLSFLPANVCLSFLIPAIAIALSSRLFKTIENVKIDKRVAMNPKLLLVRSLFAASTVVLIISSAKFVGPTWAGLFSAFPNIMLPLVIIIQFTYNPEHAYVIIKNLPKGLASLVLYALAVSFAYPVHGIYIGTLLAYGIAAVYLVATQFAKELFRRS